MRECSCPIPRDAGKNRPGYCRHCGGQILEAWTSNDQTVTEFLTHLAKLPGVAQPFIDQCLHRERAGRGEFGHQSLARDNPSEAQEEAADLALYCHLAVLRARREGRPEKLELALEAAHHAALAHEILRRL